MLIGTYGEKVLFSLALLIEGWPLSSDVGRQSRNLQGCNLDQKGFCFVIFSRLALEKKLLFMFNIHLYCLICPSIRAVSATLGWFKNPLSSQTEKLMAGTKFSDYTGLKHYER